MTEIDERLRRDILDAAHCEWEASEVYNALRKGKHVIYSPLGHLYAQCVMNDAGYRHPQENDYRWGKNGGIAPAKFDGSIESFTKIDPITLRLLPGVGKKTVERWYELLGLPKPSWTSNLTKTANADEQAVLAMGGAIKDLAGAYAAALQPLIVSINELVNAVTEFRIEVVTKLGEQVEP